MAPRNSRFSIPTIVAIGDLHAPFHNRKWLAWSIETIRRLKPEHVVQIGDLYDYFTLSKYAKSLDVITPSEEAASGRAVAETMWAEIRDASPKSKCWQIKGNHDDRGAKTLYDRAPELASFVDARRAFTFDGVKTIHDSKEELWLGDVAVLHGYKADGAHARHNQCPTIVGHSHRGGVGFFQNRLGTYWELNAGFGGDLSSPVFGYRNQRLLHGWTLGIGVVDEYGPRFVPYGGK